VKVAAIVPALDEEGAIGRVVTDLLGTERLDEVVVVDNGSSDRTAEMARKAGATVITEPFRGYGSACLRGIAHLGGRPGGPPGAVVFVDGDGSCDAAELGLLIAPIETGHADLVIGSRSRYADPGSLTIPQAFGNRLATTLMRLMHGIRTSDLGPYRAIAWEPLLKLEMIDRSYGWTVEMQLKADKRGLRVSEVDVHNHRRIAGRSKIAGTVRGVVGAGIKIIGTILRYS
jgi:glycosyltransferase involved in cell wall biosynthesis